MLCLHLPIPKLLLLHLGEHISVLLKSSYKVTETSGKSDMWHGKMLIYEMSIFGERWQVKHTHTLHGKDRQLDIYGGHTIDNYKRNTYSKGG